MVALYCPIFARFSPCFYRLGLAGNVTTIDHYCPLLSHLRTDGVILIFVCIPTPFAETEIHEVRRRCCLIGVVLSAGS